MNWEALPKDVVRFLNSAKAIPQHCAPAHDGANGNQTVMTYTFNGGNQCIVNVLNAASAEHTFAQALMRHDVNEMKRPYLVLRSAGMMMMQWAKAESTCKVVPAAHASTVDSMAAPATEDRSLRMRYTCEDAALYMEMNL
jgi:hypothetical protein